MEKPSILLVAQNNTMLIEIYSVYQKTKGKMTIRILGKEKWELYMAVLRWENSFGEQFDNI